MRILACLPVAALAACLGPAPPPPPAPFELSGGAGCATTRFADGVAGDAAMLDRLTGVYAAGRDSVSISRHGGRFLAHRVSYGVRDLTSAGADGRHYRDGCGTLYAFDGSRWLTITPAGGAPSRWRRRSH